MGIIIEDEEFNPTLRRRIAAFIDAFFEEPEVEEAVFGEPRLHETATYESPTHGAPTYGAAEPMMASAAAEPSEPSRPSRPSASSPFARGNMADAFGRALESLHVGRERKEAAASKEARDVEVADFGGAMPCEGGMPFDGDASLKSWLDQVDEPFSTTLLSLIDRKGLSDVDVYKRAHMSRQLFSRIRSDASYRPAKKTVLALAIAMELSLDEMRDLLERAGFALSRSNKRDLIVEYFVTNGIHDLFAINEALYEFDQPLI